MRHVAVTTRTIVAACAALGVVWSAGMAAALAAPDSHSATTAVAASATPLVEVPTCWAPGPVDTMAAVDGAMVETIVVTIEPTALLKVDAAGRVVAAETNTGCAPRSTDRLYVVQADGSLVEAPSFDVSNVEWTGDFTQFGFVPQQPTG